MLLITKDWMKCFVLGDWQVNSYKHLSGNDQVKRLDWRAVMSKDLHKVWNWNLNYCLKTLKMKTFALHSARVSNHCPLCVSVGQLDVHFIELTERHAVIFAVTGDNKAARFTHAVTALLLWHEAAFKSLSKWTVSRTNTAAATLCESVMFLLMFIIWCCKPSPPH